MKIYHASLPRTLEIGIGIHIVPYHSKRYDEDRTGIIISINLLTEEFLIEFL